MKRLVAPTILLLLLVLSQSGCATSDEMPSAQPPAADMNADAMTGQPNEAMEPDAKKQSTQAAPWEDAYK